jgi:hypothetical protein
MAALALEAGLLVSPVLPGAAPAPGQGKEEGDLIQTLKHRIQSQNNLKQIGRALHSHNDALGTLPAPAIHDPKLKALLSWRVALLPFLNQTALFQRFKLDEPWDSPHNKKLLGEMPAVYAAPDGSGRKEGRTYYQVFVGPQAGFEANLKMRLPASFSDGTSNTILVAEAAVPVPWTKPEDLPFSPKQPLPKLGGLFHGHFHALFADGTVRFLAKDADEQDLRYAIMRNDGQVISAKLFARPGTGGKVDPKRLPEENRRLRKAVEDLLAKVARAKEDLDVLKARLETGNPELDAQAVKLLRQNEQLSDTFVRAVEDLVRIEAERERLEKLLKGRSAKAK